LVLHEDANLAVGKPSSLKIANGPFGLIGVAEETDNGTLRRSLVERIHHCLLHQSTSGDALTQV
jgi:hypothetical protein